jgi:ribonuclease D
VRKYTFITTDAGLADFTQALQNAGVQTLAMDFEGESNLHDYGERLCLIQVYDGQRFTVLDPLTIGREAMKTFLGDRKILKLFFGAGSDIQLAFKQFDVPMNAVLDLQILAQTLGYTKLGLDSILEECLGVAPSSAKKRFQMNNWTTRPISPEAIDYALNDVEHLFALHDLFIARLEESKKLAEALRQVVLRTPSPLTEGIPGVFRSREYRDLNGPRKRHFERLVDIREQLAMELNWPPENIFSKAQMVRYVSGQLKLEELPRPKRMTSEQYDKMKRLVGASQDKP